jgi:hypothetical protein
LALGAFAAIGAVMLGHLNAAVALALATAAWFAVAIGGYFVAWFK